ncbi:hypothetical protein Q4582_03365 [Poseidonibacter sp. 1_MG-2023]|nr:hypothetical protein [Poseidonibacter sp. 1_MG-2023]
MSYKDDLRRKENINQTYKIINSTRELDIRTNNPYFDVEAHFYDVVDENNNLIQSYEVEVTTKTSTGSETIKIKKI